MKISVFGLGYVGAVSVACFAKNGHTVLGVDPNITKVDIINNGQSPIIEKDLDKLISNGVNKSQIHATTDIKDAVRNTDISFICVGTPSQVNGSLDLKYVRNVCEQIGNELKNKNSYHLVVCRSTMLPGSMNLTVIPTLEQSSGKKAGKDFGVCINPEFLREGTAIYDFYNPPKTVIGEIDDKSGSIIAELYSDLQAPLLRTSIETAEMVKYTDNVWHAVKVCFANEIGNICKKLQIDSHQVMNIFCQDTKLNLSPYYMKPGFAFGGSCLPKDVRALTYKAKSLDLELPMLNSIIPSNIKQVEHGLNHITKYGLKKIGILGFSFKAGTDDLRESPIVELIETLLGKGYSIKIYDKNVKLATLTGANKDYILNTIPHISSLMSESIEDIISHSEIIVIGNNSDEFNCIFENKTNEQIIIDLVRISNIKSIPGEYDGICW